MVTGHSAGGSQSGRGSHVQATAVESFVADYDSQGDLFTRIPLPGICAGDSSLRSFSAALLVASGGSVVLGKKRS